ANGSELVIRAESGTSDDLVTKAMGSSAGLAGIGAAKAYADVESTTAVNVETGAKVTNRFGNLVIQSLTGMGSYVTGNYNGAGLGAYPHADANTEDSTTKYNLNSYVNLGLGNTGSGSLAEILGKDVDIYAGVKRLSLVADTYAYTKAGHGRAWAYSYNLMYLNTKVNADKADMRAYNYLKVQANGTPLWGGTHIFSYAGTKIAGFIGQIWSKACVMGSTNSEVNFTGNTIAGGKIEISAWKFAGNVRIQADATVRALAIGNRHQVYWLGSNSKADVGNATYYLGGTGVAVIVDKNGNVSATGAVVTDRNNIKISNVASGSLQVNCNGNINGDFSKIYTKRYIPEVKILNMGNFDITITGIDVYNTGSNGSVKIGDRTYQTTNDPNEAAVRPVVLVESHGNGAVIINGIIRNEHGTVTIKWVGKDAQGNGITGDLRGGNKQNMGGKEVASIWTTDFLVTGAKNVGGNNAPFTVYLSIYGGKEGSSPNMDEKEILFRNPTVQIDAGGDIFTELTIADIRAGGRDKMDGINSTWAFEQALNVDLIRSSQGSIDVKLGTPVRMAYAANTSPASVPTPGKAQFMTDKVTVAEKLLGIDDL
ncbi:MAG: hypothetical protein RR361_05805, partial [Anaerovorax sp.]